MRLLYISRTSGVHDRRFTDAWRRAGFTVAEIATGTNDVLSSPASARLSAVIADFKPNIVHVGPLTHPGIDVARAWEGPIIAASWGFDLLQDVNKDSNLESAAQVVLERANLLFVDNDASARRARELGMDAAQIAQFPWGLDDPWFEVRENPPLSSASKITVLCTRRHEELYRVGDVVTSFIEAATRQKNMRLKLIGSGTLTPQLKAQASESAARDRIEFVGEVENALLPDFYRDADIYITASEVDGTSVSLLEAMASGAIAVASHNQGNAQWISEETGYGFAVNDTKAIRAVLLKLAGMQPQVVSEARRRATNARLAVESGAQWKSTEKLFPGFAIRAQEHWQRK